MRTLWGWVVLVAVTALAGTARAQAPSFNVAPAYAVGGNNCRSVAVGDFNQDGIQDLAVACNQSTASGLPFSVFILPGTGGGAFGAAVGVPVNDGQHVVTTGDFNRDGLLDLATADYSAQTVSVLMATGPATFAAPVSYTVGWAAKSVAVADFNGDGFPDLAAVAGGTMAVLLNTGSGAFGAPVSSGPGGVGVVAADFNGDGFPDLATAAGSAALVMLGTGSGTFGAAVSYPMGGSDGNATGLAVADFNADGFADLAVANEQIPYPKRSYVALFLGTGTGTFGTAVKYDIGDNARPRGVVAADFNADGVPDVAVATQDKNSVTILLATGTGAFLPPYAYGVRAMVSNVGYAVGVKYLAVGDLNADGIPDLAVASPKEGNVAVLLGTGAGKFAAASSYDAGISPSSVAVRDFNGDGLADMAVANLVSNDVSIRLGIGNGAFGPTVNYAAGGFPASVVAGDFNGDAIPDLAVANLLSNDVSILLGTGTGTFGTATNYAAGTSPSSLAVSDLNGDGFEDLAVAYYGGSSVGTLLGTGTGAFQPVVFHSSAGTSSSSVAVGDFNGDTVPDLAVANSGSNNVSILLGTGTGSFGPATTYAAGYYPTSLALGDFNGDGLLDLAVAGGLVSSSHVSVLLGTGGGAFAAPVDYPSGSRPAAVAVGDFNGDGFPDLVVANNVDSPCCYPETDTIWVLPGTGSGTFSAPLYWTVGRRPRALVVADLNGDARPDLIVAGGNELSNSPGYYWGYEVRVLLNTTPATADLSITVSDGGATPLWGGPLSYSITVTNSGPSAVTGATVSDSFPAGLAGVAWTCTASPGSACTAAGSGNLSDAAVALLPGGTATYSAIGVVVYGTTGPLVNTATVGSSAYDPVPANNSSTASTPVDGDLIFKDGFQGP